MNPIRRIRHFAAALGWLALACLGLAVAAPAAFAALTVLPPGSGAPGIAGLHEPPGWSKHPPLPGQAAAAWPSTTRFLPVHSPPAERAPTPAGASGPGPRAHRPRRRYARLADRLIAAGAAVLAVLLDRARAGRRHLTDPSA
jgi:hypothetical protein